MESAYEQLAKITHGNDTSVPVSLSLLCRMIDGEMHPSDKQEVIDTIAFYLKQHPSRVD